MSVSVRVWERDQHTISNTSPPQPLRIMPLQDSHDLPSLRHARTPSTTRSLEINQQRRRLLPRIHHINDPIQHIHQMLNLPLALLRVLLARIEIQTRPRIVVVAQDHLFPRLVLGTDVFGRPGLDAVFFAPDQRVLKTSGRVGDVPGGCAEVAEKAFAG